MDLLRGRYGLATNNVSANDVATVQVLEHHQPVKALEQVPSEQAAINLKLKDEAKGKLTLMGKLGLGEAPLQGECELAGMDFSKTWQNITTYKGNNSGIDLSGEISPLTSLASFDGDNVLTVQTPSAPGIDEKRYLFNNSNVITLNNIFKTAEDEDLTLNLAYLNDHENSKGSAITSYYLPGKENLLIVEDMTSDSNTDRLDGGLRYNLNKKEKHLENSLDISGTWDENRGDVVSTQTIHQDLKKPSFCINDNFSWIKKTSDTKGFTLNSEISFKSTPQELMIYPGMYTEIFNSGNDYSMLKQETRVTNFNSINKLTLLSAISMGHFSINPEFGLNVEYRNLNSSLYIQNNGGQLIEAGADSLKNNLDWMKYTASVSTNVKYSLNDLTITVNLPVDDHLLQLTDRIVDNEKNINRLYFQPSANIQYQLGSKIVLTGSYSFHHQLGNLMSYYSGDILTNYRNLNHNDGRLYESQENGGKIGFDYKDIGNLFFFDPYLSYSYSKSNMMYGQNFQGILSVKSPVEQESSAKGVSVNVNLSKGFDWKSIVTSFRAGYGNSTYVLLQQNQLIDCRNQRLFANGSFRCKPTSFLQFEYKGDWNNNRTLITSTEKTSSYSLLNNNLTLDIDLPRNLILNLGFEHYYNSATTKNKNISFTDLGITYIWERIHFSLDWNNIFNTDNYVTYYYDGINSYQNTYHIRPTNIMLKVKLKII
jgi:hypothetical protein